MSVAQVVLLALVALQAWLVPTFISRLPEPPAEAETQPETQLQEGGEDGAGESPLAKVLREEGPKELYAVVARIKHLAPVCVVVSLVLAFAVSARLGNHPVTWVIALLTPTLVLLSVVDWRTRLLPRVVVLPASGVLLVLAVGEWAFTHHTDVLVRTLVAALLARSFFWVLWAVRRAGMGFGDVRLAALVGLVLGRVSWNSWILGMYGGLLLFSFYGIGLTLLRRDVRMLKKHLPYGPFMVMGLYAGLLLSGSLKVI